MRRRVAAGVALWLVTALVLRVTLLASESCPAVGVTDIDRSVSAAVGWLESTALPDGRFRYAATDDGEVLPGYSIVRHAGVLLSLYQAAAGDRPVAEAARRWAMDRLVRHDDWSALADRGADRVSVGASALLVAALAARQEPADDEVLRRLGRFLLVQQQDDGSVLADWSVAAGAPVPDETSPFFTGEAFWAWTLLAERFPSEGVWAEAAGMTLEYLATEREEAEGRYPLVPDHWGAYGLAELDRPLSPAEEVWAARLAGAFGVRTRFESQQRADGLVGLVRGGHSMGSAVGTLGEGLGGLWRLSRSVRGSALAPVRAELADRLVCVAGVLVDRQADDGAWYADGVTRMDDQQHAISALLVARDALPEAFDR